MRPNWIGRRQAERKDCSIRAQARPYDGSPSIDCTVTDSSATGARIVFPPDRDPPAAFDLFVPSRGDTRHALVRWVTPEATGVEFVKARAESEDQRLSEALVRMSRLEDELRAMRADALTRAMAGAAAASPARVAPTPANQGLGPELDALMQRVAMLEARNTDVLAALKQALGLLSELRPAALARAS